jgi:uncharacterized membrane protein YhaH (DUF805 family)
MFFYCKKCGKLRIMETVYCSACAKVMSAAAQACPECGHPTAAARGPVAQALNAPFDPRGVLGPVLTVASPKISFGDAVKSFFTNYAVFSGRARRSEYWFAVLFLFLISLPVSLLDAITNPGGDFGVFTALSLLLSLATLIPSLAIASRRLHDADTSFGYYFMVLIPLVGLILLVVKLAQDGTPGANRFGESTKYLA